VTFTNSLTVFLNGKGAINHVINNSGGAVRAGHGQEWLCNSSEMPPEEEEEKEYLILGGNENTYTPTFL
jgi:hypothetical protein